MQDFAPREHYTAEDLVELIQLLRDPQQGCPWDKVQTHASIRKNFLEETCEGWRPSTPMTRPCSGRSWGMC